MSGWDDIEDGDRPEISIIIPTRNRAQMLTECLTSLSNQLGDEPVEVIVVDNGSEDDTAEICEEWGRRDRRFRYVHERRVGLSAAKNAAVGAAQGALLLFVDDDMLLDPRWIDSYRKLFAERGDGIVAGGPVLPAPPDLITWPAWLPPGSTIGLPVLDHGETRRLEPFEYVWGGNLAVPAAVCAALGGFDESLGRRGDERGTYEDVDFVDRARSRGADVWFCPEARVFHRLDRERLTPRKILRAAFAGGTMDRWRHDRGSEAGRPTSFLAALGRALLLLFRLSSWIAWTGAFRVRPGRVFFARARRSAWRSGWMFQGLARSFDDESRTSGIRRGTFLARRIALALAPDVFQ